MRPNKLLNLFLITIIIGCSPMYAQVTVGSDSDPVSGALLQLKENDNTSANSTKGLGLPRVNLLSETDASTISGMSSNAAAHVGLTVYHIKAGASTLADGVYTWTGAKWQQLTNVSVDVASSPWSNQSTGSIAQNGDHQIFLHTTDASKGTPSVAIGKATAGSGLTLDVNGATNITGATTITGNTTVTGNTSASGNATVTGKTTTGTLAILNVPSTGGSTRALTRNVYTGELEMAADIPRKLAFFQSQVQTDISPSEIRAGVVVPFATTDRVTNVLVKEPIENNEFELLEDAMIEISAYVCYIGGGVDYATRDNNNREIVVNATVQYCPAATGTWEDLSSVRGVYANAVSWYINTLNVPPVMVEGKAGDKIRVRLIQPPTGSSTAPPGGIVGYLGSSHTQAKITIPYGTRYSKGIKIIVQ